MYRRTLVFNDQYHNHSSSSIFYKFSSSFCSFNRVARKQRVKFALKNVKKKKLNEIKYWIGVYAPNGTTSAELTDKQVNLSTRISQFMTQMWSVISKSQLLIHVSLCSEPFKANTTDCAPYAKRKTKGSIPSQAFVNLRKEKGDREENTPQHENDKNQMRIKKNHIHKFHSWVWAWIFDFIICCQTIHQCYFLFICK